MLVAEVFGITPGIDLKDDATVLGNLWIWSETSVKDIAQALSVARKRLTETEAKAVVLLVEQDSKRVYRLVTKNRTRTLKTKD